MSSSNSGSSNDDMTRTIAFGSFSAACNSVGAAQSYVPRMASDLNVAAAAANNNESTAEASSGGGRQLSEAVSEYLNSNGYTVVKKLARGGFGETSLIQKQSDAQQPQQQQHQFVLKIQEGVPEKSSSFWAAFKHEVSTLKSNAHFGVVKLVDAAILPVLGDSIASVIVLEFAEGGDLSDFLKTRRIDSEAPEQQVDDDSNSNTSKRTVRFTRYLTEEEVCWLFVQMLLAVEHLHVNRSLHRDLKLKNIAVCETSLVKLLDFGLSRQYDTGVTNKVAHTQCGTLSTIAPEVLTRTGATDGGYSKLCDIFSLGIVLHDLMVGNVPAADEPDLLHNRQTMLGDTLLVNLPQPIPRNRYSKELCDLCARMISRNPCDRPQSIQEILIDSEADCPALAAAYKALREYVEFCCSDTATAAASTTIPSHLQRYVLGPRGAWSFGAKEVLPLRNAARVQGVMKIGQIMVDFVERRNATKSDDGDDDDRLGEFLQLNDYPQEFVDLFKANYSRNEYLLETVTVPKFRLLSSADAKEARSQLLSAEAGRAKYVAAKKQQQQQEGERTAQQQEKQKFNDEFAGALKMLGLLGDLVPVISDEADIAWQGFVNIALAPQAAKSATTTAAAPRRYVVFTKDGTLSVGRWEGDQLHRVFTIESVTAAAPGSGSLIVKLKADASGRQIEWTERLLATNATSLQVKPSGFVHIEDMLKVLPKVA